MWVGGGAGAGAGGIGRGQLEGRGLARAGPRALRTIHSLELGPTECRRKLEPQTSLQKNHLYANMPAPVGVVPENHAGKPRLPSLPALAQARLGPAPTSACPPSRPLTGPPSAPEQRSLPRAMRRFAPRGLECLRPGW